MSESVNDPESVPGSTEPTENSGSSEPVNSLRPLSSEGTHLVVAVAGAVACMAGGALLDHLPWIAIAVILAGSGAVLMGAHPYFKAWPYGSILAIGFIVLVGFGLGWGAKELIDGRPSPTASPSTTDASTAGSVSSPNTSATTSPPSNAPEKVAGDTVPASVQDQTTARTAPTTPGRGRSPTSVPATTGPSLPPTTVPVQQTTTPIAPIPTTAPPPDPHNQEVQYTGGIGLSVRASPTTESDAVGTKLPDGSHIHITCQTLGQQVETGSANGDPVYTKVWDEIDIPAAGWVSDAFVSTPEVGTFTAGIGQC